MLTDLTCKSLITESKRLKKPIKKFDDHGLFLHAFPNGSANWYHKYTIHGNSRQIAYGRYPTISLTDARIKRNEAYKLIKEGIDPKIVRQKHIDEAIKENTYTFEKVSLEWYNRNIRIWSPSHAKNVLLRLEKHLFPDLGKEAINKISRKQLLKVIRKVEATTPFGAKRSVQYAIRIFTYAVDEDYAEANIALGMEKSLQPQKHGNYASMDIDSLSDFLQDLDMNVAGLSYDRKDAIELLMLTVVRPNELIKAEWTEFDFDRSIWSIPAARMKMRHDHIVPLSQQAKAILWKRYKWDNSAANPYGRSKFVFPSRTRPGKHLCHNTICQIIIDMKWQGKHTGHGFRALFMGIAKERLKYRHEVPDRQLAHVPKGSVNRAYDRAMFLDERVKLMQEYADYVDRQRQSKIETRIVMPVPTVSYEWRQALPTGQYEIVQNGTVA